MANLPEGVLHCKKCQKHKATTEFYERKTRGGFSKFCKTCTAEMRTSSKNGLPEFPEFLECQVCKETKERAAFRGHRTGGSAPICRLCRAQYVKDHNIDTTKKYRLPNSPIVDGKKNCTGCGRNLIVSMFSKNLSAPHGLEWKCRDCKEIARKQYMKTVPDAYWSIRRKNRHIYGDLSLEFVRDLYESHKYCEYCRITFSAPNEAHFEHRIPRSKGGQSTPENFTFACDQCNRAKNDMSEVEFREWLIALVKRMHIATASEPQESGQSVEMNSFGDAANRPGTISTQSGVREYSLGDYSKRGT